MATATRIVALLVVGHLVAWLVTFAAFVGFSPELGPTYFIGGWSFSGGEMPSLVWLYSWAVFLALALGYLGIRWLLRRRIVGA
jgi:hypothetical protein